MKMGRALILMAVLTAAAAGLIAVASPAPAAGRPTAGTYQVFVGGKPFGTWVLGRGGGVSPYDAASWSIQNHVFTLTSYGLVLPAATCLRYGQTWPCQFSANFTGHKTADGIASPSALGLYTENANSAVMSFSTFYAIRSGGVRQGSHH